MATRAEYEERAERRARILAEAIAAGREALRRQAARNSARHLEAEDALQDACVEFLRYYDGPPGEQALRYLMVAVRHRAWANSSEAWQRHRAPTELTTTDFIERGVPRVSVLCERPGPAEGAESHELLLRRVAILAELKPDERTAILLAALGYTYREIADLQGWTNTKVNRCLAEGRADLRRLAEGGELSPPNP